MQARCLPTLEGIAGVEVENSLMVDGQLWDVLPGDVGVCRHLVEISWDYVLRSCSGVK